MQAKLALPLLLVATLAGANGFFLEREKSWVPGERAWPTSYGCQLSVRFNVPPPPANPRDPPLPLSGVEITYTGTGCDARWREAANKAAIAVAQVAP